MSPKTATVAEKCDCATVAENGEKTATVAEFGDSRTSATIVARVGRL